MLLLQFSFDFLLDLCVMFVLKKIIVIYFHFYIFVLIFSQQHEAKFLVVQLHQWPSSFAFKASKWEVLDSILGRACRPSCSEFSVVFSETRVNTGQDPLKRPPTEGTPSVGPRPICGQSALNLQPNSDGFLQVKSTDL